jgi:hypothetical protein
MATVAIRTVCRSRSQLDVAPRASLAGICSVHRSPSAAKSVSTVALSARVTIWSVTNRPNPLRADGVTGGPPCSRHSMRKDSGAVPFPSAKLQLRTTRPSGAAEKPPASRAFFRKAVSFAAVPTGTPR